MVVQSLADFVVAERVGNISTVEVDRDGGSERSFDEGLGNRDASACHSTECGNIAPVKRLVASKMTDCEAKPRAVEAGPRKPLGTREPTHVVSEENGTSPVPLSTGGQDKGKSHLVHQSPQGNTQFMDCAVFEGRALFESLNDLTVAWKILLSGTEIERGGHAGLSDLK